MSQIANKNKNTNIETESINIENADFENKHMIINRYEIYNNIVLVQSKQPNHWV